MPRLRPFLLTPVLLLFSFLVSPAQDTLTPQLEPFRPYLNKTWRAPVGRGAHGQPIYDVARWERALNGKAIRVLHSVDNGAYGGESILMWDPSKRSLVFHYFTTAGFYTRGTTTVGAEGMTNMEEVVGNDNGITQVESRSRISEDGTMIVVSRMLKNGEWQDRETVVYTHDPDAEVRFR